MGTGAEIVHETVDVLAKKGEKVGLIKVRLYRPFSMDHFLAALPKTVKAISVLDRTKEPGCAGEPMYQDVITALAEAQSAGKLPFAMPKVVAAATACRPRSSPRPWSRRCTTISRSRPPRTISPWASTTT